MYIISENLVRDFFEPPGGSFFSRQSDLSDLSDRSDKSDEKTSPQSLNLL